MTKVYGGISMRRARLKSLVILASIALSLCSSLMAPMHTQASSYDGAMPGEVVVKLLNANDLIAVAQDYNLDPIPIDQINSYTIYRLRIIDGNGVEVVVLCDGNQVIGVQQ